MQRPRDSATPLTVILGQEQGRFWLKALLEQAEFIASGLLPGEGQRAMQEMAERGSDLLMQSELLRGEGALAAWQEQFTAFAVALKEQQRAVLPQLSRQAGGWLYPSFVEHALRHADFCLKLLAARAGAQRGGGAPPLAAANWWLRSCGDSAGLLMHWLDPAERMLGDAVRECRRELINLELQGRELVTLVITEPSGMTLRFLQDAEAGLRHWRDMMQAVAALVRNCQVLSILPAGMAAHLLAEAEQALLLLTLLGKGMVAAPVWEEEAPPVPDILIGSAPLAEMVAETNEPVGVEAPALPPVAEPPADFRASAPVAHWSLPSPRQLGKEQK